MAAVLSVVILIVAVIVYWKIRSLAKKVAKLEGEKLQLQSKVDDLVAQVKIIPNDIAVQQLQSELAKLQTQIADKNAQIAALKADADAKMAELESAKPW